MKRLIILAAGRGTRLGPITDALPKCMVPLAGKPLLEWQLDTAREAGAEAIIVVRGYRGDQLTLSGVTYVENPAFASTNMVYSLWCARQYFATEFVLSYGDILYNPDVLRALFRAPHAIAVAVDSRWLSYWRQRFANPLSDAESLQLDADGCIVDIGKKVRALSDIQGQYVGLVGFRDRGVDVLRTALAERAQTCEGQARPNGSRPFAQQYVTDLLQGLIDQGHSIHSVPTEGGWLEIDTLGDLHLASRLVRVRGGQLVVQR